MRIILPKKDQAFLSDPSELYRLKPQSDKKDKIFRDFTTEIQQNEIVRKTYYDMHVNQSVAFVKEKHQKWLSFNHASMTIMEAIHLLDDLIDESDPDIGLPNSIHAFQTAERIREKYPDSGWFQLTGLIHDLGKVLALWGEPQWCVVGDTFPVGCQFQDACVYSEYFSENPDYHNPLYNTKCGIYKENCGLDNVLMSWGHDEYLYQVLKRNDAKLPEEAFYFIRFHSFYPYHEGGAYQHLCNEKDQQFRDKLKEFSSFDLYSKSEVQPDVAALKGYYQALIDKYIPGELKW